MPESPMSSLAYTRRQHRNSIFLQNSSSSNRSKRLTIKKTRERRIIFTWPLKHVCRGHSGDGRKGCGCRGEAGSWGGRH